jgi:dimethylargininase
MIAFTREVSPSIGRCELTHVERTTIDIARAREQHRAFEQALRDLGCDVRRLPDAPDLPDAVFVQDTAVVVDEIAVIARPGAESRRPEVASVAAALAAHRSLQAIEPPGTLDGGDVICVGRRVFVGQSSRTNTDGIRQLDDYLQPFGYAVHRVLTKGCLHLQSAATPVANGLWLVNRQWVDPAVFEPIQVIDIDPAEPFAANALRIGDVVVYPAEFPRTKSRLEANGVRVVTVALSELAKAEGGVTCCCILVPPVGRANCT